MTLLSWYDIDELQPYPWATIECPGCEETELARYDYGGYVSHMASGNPYTWFVCMACGRLTQVEAETFGADVMTPIKLSDYEVSGTVTTGVMVWCPECEDWFAHWTSRQQYPNVQQIVDECKAHSAERHPVTEEHQS